MKKLITLLLIFSSIVILTGCFEKPVVDERPLIEQVKTELVIDSELDAITLPSNIDGILISWTSSKLGIISTEGVIIKPLVDTNVSLTAILTSGTTTMTKVFNVVILGEYELVDYTIIQTAVDNLIFDDYDLIEDITLMTSFEGVSITWESSNDEYLNAEGIVNRPGEDAGDEEVILTATFTYNEIVLEKEFTFTVYDMSLTVIYFGYYYEAEGLYGDDLISALHTIINTGFVGIAYGEARTILAETDEDPNNPNNLILIYLADSISSIWDEGDTWNREHIWPQSLLGESASNPVVNTCSDLYNLMPANPSENSSRSNSPYSELGLGYEPRDEVKGDVARALFYMMIMYDELELVNTHPGLHEMGYLDELIAWHYADPVDEFELNRQEVIYSYQLNRNPFVDYSDFVELIWLYDEIPAS